MPKKIPGDGHKLSAQPHYSQRSVEIQAFGTVNNRMPLQLEEAVRLEMTEQLNLLLADTITLRDLYKKSHWQVSGPTFYQLHLLIRQAFWRAIRAGRHDRGTDPNPRRDQRSHGRRRRGNDAH